MSVARSSPARRTASSRRKTVRQRVPCDAARAEHRFLRAVRRPGDRGPAAMRSRVRTAREPRSHANCYGFASRDGILGRVAFDKNGDPTQNLLPIFRVAEERARLPLPGRPRRQGHSYAGAARALRRPGLSDPAQVSLQRALDGGLADGTPRQREERDRARLLPKGLPGAGQHAVAEESRARGPGGTVVAPPLRAHLRADRDQLGEIRDRIDT